MIAHEIILNVSGLTTWQECERLYSYSYLHGYRSQYDNDPITFGNWTHYALRLVAMGSTYADALAKTLKRQIEMEVKSGEAARPELWVMFVNLMSAHELWQQKSDNLYTDSKLEYLNVEETFSFEFGGYKFKGTWDGIAKHKHLGGLYLVERKTTANPNDLEKGINYDFQPRVYAWAAEQVYQEPVVGVIYEIIRRTDPTTTKILKNGWPSKARNELDGTTLEVYSNLLFDTADKLGYTYETVLIDYAEQLAYLKLNHNPVFRRVLVPMPTRYKEMAAKTLLFRAAQMAAAQGMGEDLPPKLNRYSCPKCPFKYACLAQDDGADYISLLDATFVKGKERFDA